MNRTRMGFAVARAVGFVVWLCLVAVVLALVDSITGRDQRHRNAAREERKATVDLNADEYTVSTGATARSASAAAQSPPTASDVTPGGPPGYSASVGVDRQTRGQVRDAARRNENSRR